MGEGACTSRANIRDSLNFTVTNEVHLAPVLALITGCSTTSYDPSESALLKVLAEHVDEC